MKKTHNNTRKDFWKNKDFLEISIVAIVVFSYLSSYHFYSTPYLYGVDPYYHTRVASIYREQGLIRTFPWMQYTYFNQSYVDRWLLFHIAQIPFTIGDPILGAKLFVSFFATVMVLVFYYLMKRFDVKYAWLWVALLLSSRGFFFRMSLGRAYLFANIFLLLGFYFLSRKEYKGLFLVSVLFTLTYSSFPLILFFTVVFIVSEYIHEKRLEKKSLAYCALGIFVGLVINPYFPSNIMDYAHQINNMLFWMKTNDYSDAQMSEIVPGETMPPMFWDITNTSNLLIFLLAFGAESYLFSKKRKNLFSDRRTEITAAILISIPFGMMYLTTSRFNEYWVPFATLACALCFGPIIREYLKNSSGFKILNKRISSVGILASASFAVFLFLNPSWIYMLYGQAITTQNDFIEDSMKMSSWLLDNSPQGSLVFVSWDYFATLFFFNTHNYYVVGMDPLYLNIHNETLFDSYLLIMSGEESDIYQALVDNFHADYIAVTQRDRIFTSLGMDSRFNKVYEDDSWSLYEI